MDVVAQENIYSQGPQLLPNMSYKTLNLNAKTKLQIGLENLSSSCVAVIYEQISQYEREARVLVIIYETKEVSTPIDLSGVFSSLNEPRELDSYRLPYKSAFNCKIGSIEDFRHTYSPHEENIEIDSNTFVKLFDIGLLGSAYILLSELGGLHQYISDHFPRITIIHAIEVTNPQPKR